MSTILKAVLCSKLKTLMEWETHFEGKIKASTLRAEVKAGRLRAIRARPGCNATILVSEDEMARWLTDVAGQRQSALSPMQAGEVSKQANQKASKEPKTEFQLPPAIGGAVETPTNEVASSQRAQSRLATSRAAVSPRRGLPRRLPLAAKTNPGKLEETGDRNARSAAQPRAALD